MSEFRVYAEASRDVHVPVSITEVSGTNALKGIGKLPRERGTPAHRETSSLIKECVRCAAHAVSNRLPHSQIPAAGHPGRR